MFAILGFLLKYCSFLQHKSQLLCVNINMLADIRLQHNALLEALKYFSACALNSILLTATVFNKHLKLCNNK